MHLHSFTQEKGFTLTELLLVIVISAITMAATFSMYQSFMNGVSRESAVDDINSNVKSVFKIIEKDIMMAGYGMPQGTRVASHNTCSAGDESFCKDKGDRLFLADGWEILKDVTDNSEDDGKIIPMYMTFLANKKDSSAGGYSANLTGDVSSSDTTAGIASLDLNAGEETSADRDFSASGALIIGDNARAEGHRINTVSDPPDPATVTLLVKDPFSDSYLSAASSVVPAIAWYVRSDPPPNKTYSDGTPVYWLYKNEDKVMPYVDDFQVQYGYDANNNGLEWDDVVPPVVNPDGVVAFSFSHLKVLRVTMTIKSVVDGITKTTPYQTIIGMRN